MRTPPPPTISRFGTAASSGPGRHPRATRWRERGHDKKGGCHDRAQHIHIYMLSNGMTDLLSCPTLVPANASTYICTITGPYLDSDCTYICAYIIYTIYIIYIVYIYVIYTIYIIYNIYMIYRIYMIYIIYITYIIYIIYMI